MWGGCILLLLGIVYCICQFDSDGLTVFRSSVSLLIFCLVLSVAEKRMLKSPGGTVDLPTSSFNSIIFCFSYLRHCLVNTHLGLLDLTGRLILLPLYIVVPSYSFICEAGIPALVVWECLNSQHLTLDRWGQLQFISYAHLQPEGKRHHDAIQGLYLESRLYT